MKLTKYAMEFHGVFKEGVLFNDSIFSSNKTNWETPQFLFEKLNEEFNFTLDVCASADNTKCNNFYTPEMDGLSKDWQGTVWMNPPYGREIARWIEKAYKQSELGCICVCLLPVRSDTRWWHNYVMKSSEVRLLTKRLSFQGSNNKAPFPVAIVIFDKNNKELKLTSLFI